MLPAGELWVTLPVSVRVEQAVTIYPASVEKVFVVCSASGDLLTTRIYLHRETEPEKQNVLVLGRKAFEASEFPAEKTFYSRCRFAARRVAVIRSKAVATQLKQLRSISGSIGDSETNSSRNSTVAVIENGRAISFLFPDGDVLKPETLNPSSILVEKDLFEEVFTKSAIFYAFLPALVRSADDSGRKKEKLEIYGFVAGGIAFTQLGILLWFRQIPKWVETVRRSIDPEVLNRLDPLHRLVATASLWYGRVIEELFAGLSYKQEGIYKFSFVEEKDALSKTLRNIARATEKRPAVKLSYGFNRECIEGKKSRLFSVMIQRLAEGFANSVGVL